MTSSSLAIKLHNQLSISATVFLQADRLNKVYLTDPEVDVPTATVNKNIVGNAAFDCTSSGGRYDPDSATTKTTLFFELAPNEYRTIWIDKDSYVVNGKIWIESYENANRTASSTKSTFVSWTTTATAAVQYYISAEESVSCGVVVSSSSLPLPLRLTPPDPRLQYASVQVSTDTSPTSTTRRVLSPKYTETRGGVYEMLAQFPAFLAESACGLHRARVYHALLLSSGMSYDNWIHDNQNTTAMAMCWPFDDWTCIDESCGYNSTGIGQPKQLTNSGLGSSTTAGPPEIDGCTIPMPVTISTDIGSSSTILWNPLEYSCGMIESLARPSLLGTVENRGPSSWWKTIGSDADATGVGCTATGAQLKQTTSSFPLVIKFVELEWLTGRPPAVNEISTGTNAATTNPLNVVIPSIDGSVMPPRPHTITTTSVVTVVDPSAADDLALAKFLRDHTTTTTTRHHHNESVTTQNQKIAIMILILLTIVLVVVGGRFLL